MPSRFVAATMLGLVGLSAPAAAWDIHTKITFENRFGFNGTARVLNENGDYEANQFVPAEGEYEFTSYFSRSLLDWSRIYFVEFYSGTDTQYCKMELIVSYGHGQPKTCHIVNRLDSAFRCTSASQMVGDECHAAINAKPF